MAFSLTKTIHFWDTPMTMETPTYIIQSTGQWHRPLNKWHPCSGFQFKLLDLVRSPPWQISWQLDSIILSDILNDTYHNISWQTIWHLLWHSIWSIPPDIRIWHTVRVRGAQQSCRPPCICSEICYKDWPAGFFSVSSIRIESLKLWALS